MKQSRKYLLAVGSLLLIVSTLGLGIQQLTKPPALTSNIQYMLVDWAEYYRSIEEMAQASEVDVIARGVIKDVEYEGFGQSTAKSKYLFKPHWIIKGLSTARPVWIHQTGGLTPLGETYMPLSDPLMQVGDELILFLKERTREPDTYWVAGGPQGRFVVQGGACILDRRSVRITKRARSTGDIHDDKAFPHRGNSRDRFLYAASRHGKRTVMILRLDASCYTGWEYFLGLHSYRIRELLFCNEPLRAQLGKLSPQGFNTSFRACVTSLSYENLYKDGLHPIYSHPIIIKPPDFSFVYMQCLHYFALPRVR